MREDAGKAAIQYGPFVMCTEEKDNGKDLYMLKLCPEDLNAQVEKREICGMQLPVVRVNGKSIVREEQEELYTLWYRAPEECRRIEMVPYFAWGNRGEGEMRVWQRTE